MERGLKVACLELNCFWKAGDKNVKLCKDCRMRVTFEKMIGADMVPSFTGEPYFFHAEALKGLSMRGEK